MGVREREGDMGWSRHVEEARKIRIGNAIVTLPKSSLLGGRAASF